MKFLKKLFKSKEEKWKEKLMKDYEEGKVLKIEKPNPQNQNQNNNQNNNKNKHHHNHKHNKNKERR